MHADSKKTLAILGAAGTLIAAALVLDRSPAEGHQAVRPSPPPSALEQTKDACDLAAPAKLDADFGPGTLRAALSSSRVLRGAGGQVFAAIDLDTKAVTGGTRPPLNLAIVVDRSGSMSGDKFAHAKRAALGMVDRLDATDRVALVQYDDYAQVVVASTATDVEGKATLRRAIEGLTIGGSTNLHEGLVLGREEVRKGLVAGQVSRVILLSDGQPTVGVQDPAQITDEARSGADKGVRITSVGVGADYNEDLMEAIAEAGRGNYYYVEDTSSLQAVMTGELAGIQATVATAVELRLEPGCAGVELVGVLGYDSTRDGAALVVPMADLFGADHRTLLVELKVPDGASGKVAALEASLGFADPTSGKTTRKAIALALEVSGDPALVDASADRAVMAQVLKIQAARTMRQAAIAYDKGDTQGALQMIAEEKRKVEATRGRYGIAPAATAPALDGLAGMASDVGRYDRASEGGKMLMKASKSAARDLSKGKK
jgi:Ca-activated chloride channel family protein